MSRGAVALRLAALVSLGACSKSSATALATSEAIQANAAPMDSVETQAWARALDGTEDERIHLYGLVGCVGLRERADLPAHRLTAIRSMRYCDDFSELPWLAAVATAGPEDEASAALDAIVDMAAQPRRATDPEDGQELSEGCQTLLAQARATGQAQARRVMAIRALRMLADRGCVKRADIPTDLDGRD